MKKIGRLIVIAIVLVIAISTLIPTTANAAGLNLNAYCQGRGFSHATLTQQNAYGWVCVAYDGSYHGMDLNQACQQQYGSGWWASYANFNDPYSWECEKWCSVEPNAEHFGWQGTNPNYALRINGPKALDWAPNDGEEYYIYYNSQHVGSGTVDPHGYYPGGYMEWGIDTTWALGHFGWNNDSNWRIDYTTRNNTCPYTKH